jgi:hypothetical protein
MSSDVMQEGGMPEDEMQQMLDVSLIGYCILLHYGLLQSVESA